MKKVFFALILFCCTPFSAQTAENLQKYEEECRSIIASPRVEVTSTYGKLKYNYQKDGAYLRKETEKKYKYI